MTNRRRWVAVVLCIAWPWLLYALGNADAGILAALTGFGGVWIGEYYGSTDGGTR